MSLASMKQLKYYEAVSINISGRAKNMLTRDIPMTTRRKSMVNRRSRLFPSKPGVHVMSTAFGEVDDSSTDVISGGCGNSRNTQSALNFKTNC